MYINNLPITSNLVESTMKNCQFNDNDSYLVIGAKVAANTLITPVFAIVALVEAAVIGFFYAAQVAKDLINSSASTLRGKVKPRLQSTPSPKHNQALTQISKLARIRNGISSAFAFAYNHKGKIAFTATLGSALALEHFYGYPVSSKIAKSLRSLLSVQKPLSNYYDPIFWDKNGDSSPASPLFTALSPVPRGYYPMMGPSDTCPAPTFSTQTDPVPSSSFSFTLPQTVSDFFSSLASNFHSLTQNLGSPFNNSDEGTCPVSEFEPPHLPQSYSLMNTPNSTPYLNQTSSPLPNGYDPMNTSDSVFVPPLPNDFNNSTINLEQLNEPLDTCPASPFSTQTDPVPPYAK